MLSPTGGWIRPISMLMVTMTPNHTGSKPAAVMICSRLGLVIRMIAAGGMKKPHTNRNTLMTAISTPAVDMHFRDRLRHLLGEVERLQHVAEQHCYADSTPDHQRSSVGI